MKSPNILTITNLTSSSMANSTPNYLPCKIRTLFITFFFTISTLSLSTLFFFPKLTLPQKTTPQLSKIHTSVLKLYLFELPPSLNYGLLQEYLSLPDPDNPSGSSHTHDPYPPYPVYRQSSAEYWLLGDILTPESLRNGSIVKRVYNVNESDVVFVPFFASLSVGYQIKVNERVIGNKDKSNGDYLRQKMVVDLVMNSDAWKNSGGRDHIFVLTDPMAMLHVKQEIAPAILLAVDFGAWFKLEPRSSYGPPPGKIQHTQVSLLKDVIVPYTHLFPALHLSENQPRHNLLYFKGGKHRSRGGIVRASLWELLENEPGVVMEEGLPNAAGVQQSIPGMRASEFCLNPAGDTPTSCRLFDAIQSLCIPVVVSDQIELPFEGMIDYTDFSVFVSTKNALQPKWLINHLQSISTEQRDEYRRNMARVQPMFEYDNGYPGGIGPINPDGAVNQIWKKIQQKVPLIKEAVTRERRKPSGVSIPLRCQCT